MKSLADQIREQLVKPGETTPGTQAGPVAKKARNATMKEDAPIIAAIRAYDNSANKSMVHTRFDEKTVRIMNQFKMATGVDVTKLVSFAVRHLLETCPEIRSAIKQFIQNNDL